MPAFAFVFPGQGSQSVGMLDGFGDHPAVLRTLQEASSAIDLDLLGLIRNGPKESLDLTVHTQPVMLAAGIACLNAWRAEGGAEPAAVAGHSLGEYSALVAAGALSLADAMPLVRLRAEAMQKAVPVGEGAMAAILGLDADVVSKACAEIELRSGQPVAAANFNDPKQTVIAGSKAAVDAACVRLREMGAKRALLLAVSAPFHSPLMRPAAEALRERLASVPIQTPRLPVVNNIDVAVCSDPDDIRDALYRQAFGPVRWVEVVRALQARGLQTVIECGPGKVLAGLVKRIDADMTTASIADPASLQATMALVA